MKFTFNQQTLQNVLKQRDLVLWSCLGLVIINGLLVSKILHQEEHWVIFPQENVDHRIELTSSKYSDEYFVDWATGVLNIILCVNPGSIDWKIQQILKITTERYGTLKETLQAEAKLIKKDQISTVFYPKKFTVNQSQQSIDVTGQHIAYFGKDLNPVSTEKTYRLTWVASRYGVILLKDLQELKNV
ncbi:TraE/TraK family type IV conjugative transfer system protein [Candidatus Odyssella thessalonicensis]|uniref:TraE/TraK family type IV conjugative transfer system protein n=1 Tax=Candidatus Odyssella thessalonicensis TaxID=84647 RepID=UPI000225B981|nr:TraE/TraK family type IV conjugative transfer system protein [Candidatus Odyssella thessalonicensis]